MTMNREQIIKFVQEADARHEARINRWKNNMQFDYKKTLSADDFKGFEKYARLALCPVYNHPNAGDVYEKRLGIRVDVTANTYYYEVEYRDTIWNTLVFSKAIEIYNDVVAVYDKEKTIE